MADEINFKKKAVKATDTIYTDRLIEWDYEKYNKLCKKHFGNDGHFWDKRESRKIESFLRDWVDDEKLELVMVSKSKNRLNGQPLWRFDYNI